MLEDDLQTCLHLSRVGCRVRVLSQGCRSQSIRETGKVRVIENIEDFPAELKRESLCDLRILQHGPVEFLEIG